MEDVWRLILANVRTPEERSGDLDAQLAALHTGRVRLLEMAARRGADAVLVAMRALVAYADRLVAAGLTRIPDGRYLGRDALEDDGFGSGPIPIEVALTVAGDRLVVDFEGTSPQVEGGVNAVAAITASATRYVVRCVVQALLGEPLPAGGGSMRAVELRLPEGSVVNAQPPAAVAAGNVETSQRITDVLLLAFGAGAPRANPGPLPGHHEQHHRGGREPRYRRALRLLRDGGRGHGRRAGRARGCRACTPTCPTP